MKFLRFIISRLLILYCLSSFVYADNQCDPLTEHSLDVTSFQLSLKALNVGNSFYDGEFAYLGVINDKHIWKLQAIHQSNSKLPTGCQSKENLTGNDLVLSSINTSNNGGKYSATFELVQQGVDYFIILKNYAVLTDSLSVENFVIPPYNPNAPFPGLIVQLLDALVPTIPKLSEYRDAALAAEITALSGVAGEVSTKFGNVNKPIAKSNSSSTIGAAASQFITLTGGIANSNAPYTGSKTESLPNGNGTVTVTVGADGATTTELTTKVDLPILLLQGNSKISLAGAVCPDSNGKVEFIVRFSDAGKAGTNGAIQYEHQLEAKVKASVDDDANLISSDFEVKQTTRSSGGGQSSNVESSLSGQISSSLDFINIRQTGVPTNEDAVRGLSLASGALVGAQNFWEHGGCIEINATSPGKVAPGTTSKIPVSVKHKKDGSSVPAKINIELTGGASIQPSVINPAPGEITHIATSEKGKEMTITLKASSRRGKDSKVLTLTTKDEPNKNYTGTITFTQTNSDFLGGGVLKITGSADVLATYKNSPDDKNVSIYKFSGIIRQTFTYTPVPYGLQCNSTTIEQPLNTNPGTADLAVYLASHPMFPNTFSFTAVPNTIPTINCSGYSVPLLTSIHSVGNGSCTDRLNPIPFTDETHLVGHFHCGNYIGSVSVVEDISWDLTATE